MRHDGDDGRQAAVADRQPYGVGTGRGQAAAGVLQHRRGDVDAERSPAQSAYAAGVNAGAAADLQADASSPAQQAAERGIDAERIGPRRGGSGQELVLIPVRDLVLSRRRQSSASRASDLSRNQRYPADHLAASQRVPGSRAAIMQGRKK